MVRVSRSRATTAARLRPRPVRPARVRATSAGRAPRPAGESSHRASSPAWARKRPSVGASSSTRAGRRIPADRWSAKGGRAPGRCTGPPAPGPGRSSPDAGPPGSRTPASDPPAGPSASGAASRRVSADRWSAKGGRAPGRCTGPPAPGPGRSSPGAGLRDSRAPASDPPVRPSAPRAGTVRRGLGVPMAAAWLSPSPPGSRGAPRPSAVSAGSAARLSVGSAAVPGRCSRSTTCAFVPLNPKDDTPAVAVPE